MQLFCSTLILAVVLSSVQAFHVSYEFPPTETDKFVHGLCVMGATSADAEASSNSLSYTPNEDPFKDGMKLWGDRDYTSKGVKGDEMCQGGIYLEPNKHSAISLGTKIKVSAHVEADKPVTVCAFITETEYDNRHGDWPAKLPGLGFSVSKNKFSWGTGKGIGYMRSFCRDIETNKGSSSGDPHFKTWTGDKFDYHGECDLVLVNDPSFADGLGLHLHIRTTRVKYFSFIETAALQIGDNVLEFNNDVDNFLINGSPVEKNRKHHKTMLGNFEVRRDRKFISVRLHDEGRKTHDGNNVAKIDFHMRQNGFPAVIVDAGHTDIFNGSLGLLGEWGTGRKLARDGKTVIDMEGDDATAFALEWQVRNTEPMIFKEARFPQFPTICVAPAKMTGNRLGMSAFKMEAEEACAHWQEDKDDCIFDVMATRDVLVAEEGHIAHIE